MNIAKLILASVFLYALAGCSGDKLQEKGFAVTTPVTDERKPDGISKDSLTLTTKPSNVLLTGVPQIRLTTIYKVNYRDDKKTFIGSNDFHYNSDDIGTTYGNQWHDNFMPGWEAVYGYNMVNISHYDTQTQKHKDFFERPVLVKTLYYPAYTKDTLNYKPVYRNFFMASVYDEDTNKDGFINIKDLRRFYFFDINAAGKRSLVPPGYSVLKSEYDPGNDFMFIFAQWDENGNGKSDEGEAIHIFWIDLENPEKTGRQY